MRQRKGARGQSLHVAAVLPPAFIVGERIRAGPFPLSVRRRRFAGLNEKRRFQTPPASPQRAPPAPGLCVAVAVLCLAVCYRQVLVLDGADIVVLAWSAAAQEGGLLVARLGRLMGVDALPAAIATHARWQGGQVCLQGLERRQWRTTSAFSTLRQIAARSGGQQCRSSRAGGRAHRVTRRSRGRRGSSRRRRACLGLTGRRGELGGGGATVYAA